MSFFGDLNRFERKAIDKDFERVRRAAILEVASGVVLDTPVDTGRARGNWQTRVGTPASDTTERLDPAGSAAIAEARSNVGRPDDDVYITNNLPYIARLNDGYSKQAPRKFVEANVMRVRDNLRRGGF